MGILQEEYWSGLPGLLPRDVPKPRIEPRSPTFQVYFLLSEPSVKSITSFVLEEKLKPCFLNAKKAVQEVWICILGGFSHFTSQDVKEGKDS